MYKFLVFVLFGAFSISAIAKDVLPYKGALGEPMYLLDHYGCARVFPLGPIDSQPRQRVLVISADVYERLEIAAAKAAYEKAARNKELKRMSAKAKSFEENGNIEAMRHWGKKSIELQERLVYTMMRDQKIAFVREIVKEFNPALYHGIVSSRNNIVKAETFDSLIELTGGDCRAAD